MKTSCAGLLSSINGRKNNAHRPRTVSFRHLLVHKTTRGYRQIGPNVWTVVHRGERLPFSAGSLSSINRNRMVICRNNAYRPTTILRKVVKGHQWISRPNPTFESSVGYRHLLVLKDHPWISSIWTRIEVYHFRLVTTKLSVHL